MNDNIQIKLDALRENIKAPIKDLAENLTYKLGDNLESITIVGSSLTEDYKPGKSDINTVLVLKQLNLGVLNELAAMAKSMRRKKLAVPLLMTDDYINRSCDVFGVEFLDFQLTHQTIFGDDPFANLNPTKKDVRLQCERELKAMLIRLKQGYITAAGNKRLVRDILISTVVGLASLLRAMLWLNDIERPVLAGQVFEKSAEHFSVTSGMLTEIIGWRHKRITISKDELQHCYDVIYTTVEQLAHTVDNLEV